MDTVNWHFLKFKSMIAKVINDRKWSANFFLFLWSFMGKKKKEKDKKEGIVKL
jgi:hypothetical protein